MMKKMMEKETELLQPAQARSNKTRTDAVRREALYMHTAQNLYSVAHVGADANDWQRWIQPMNAFWPIPSGLYSVDVHEITLDYYTTFCDRF